MLPEHRIPTHPSVILRKEFLAPLGLTQVAFARHIRVPVQRVNEIVRGRRGVTPDTAWRLAQALGTSPEFWIHLQSAHDLGLRGQARAAASAEEGPRQRHRRALVKLFGTIEYDPAHDYKQDRWRR